MYATYVSVVIIFQVHVGLASLTHCVKSSCAFSFIAGYSSLLKIFYTGFGGGTSFIENKNCEAANWYMIYIAKEYFFKKL